ncbi:hypothetical protein [Piscinibacter terrae]|uniref:Glycerate kinase n=1 Tax=Piscinibacter terrae TaxID=2496871 RepID=A0A3N7IZB0_9BURK|nr:hypothetical protein [Albitalea terrae]RQP24052.1 hypothetical protein DZC73_11990 [Albitalea terrae]
MNPTIGWILAVLIVITAWQAYGWQGVFFAISLVVFWLLLQFNRSMRVMKNAAGAPMGDLEDTDAFNARLKVGMTLMQVLTITRSLGVKVRDVPETYRWTDPQGAGVALVFDNGRLQRWTLERPEPGLAVPAP